MPQCVLDGHVIDIQCRRHGWNPYWDAACWVIGLFALIIPTAALIEAGYYASAAVVAALLLSIATVALIKRLDIKQRHHEQSERAVKHVEANARGATPAQLAEIIGRSGICEMSSFLGAETVASLPSKLVDAGIRGVTLRCWPQGPAPFPAEALTVPFEPEELKDRRDNLTGLLETLNHASGHAAGRTTTPPRGIVQTFRRHRRQLGRLPIALATAYVLVLVMFKPAAILTIGTGGFLIWYVYYGVFLHLLALANRAWVFPGGLIVQNRILRREDGVMCWRYDGGLVVQCGIESATLRVTELEARVALAAWHSTAEPPTDEMLRAFVDTVQPSARAAGQADCATDSADTR